MFITAVCVLFLIKLRWLYDGIGKDSLYPPPPPWVQNWPVAEIDQLIEYYHCDKFGAFIPKCTIILPFSSTIPGEYVYLHDFLF